MPTTAPNANGRLSSVLRTLQAERDRLRPLGVRHLSVFGSTARDEARDDSDVDLIIDLDPDRQIDIFDLASIAAEVEAMLGRPVDLVRRGALKPHVAEQALKDEVRAF